MHSQFLGVKLDSFSKKKFPLRNNLALTLGISQNMVDFLTKQARSRLMSKVRSEDTQPERLLRSNLHGMGLRFRIHVKKLPGTPDIVLPRYKCVVFVHGCFWHRHPNCKRATIPKTNTDFWIEKFNKNVARDIANENRLRELGWKVLVVWDCQLRNKVKAYDIISELASLIRC